MDKPTTSSQINELRSFIADAVEIAPDIRESLIADPHAVIKALLPDLDLNEIKIAIVEEDVNTITIPILPATLTEEGSEELTEEQLSSISGGVADYKKVAFDLLLKVKKAGSLYAIKDSPGVAEMVKYIASEHRKSRLPR